MPRVLVIENDAIAPLELVERWLVDAGLEVEILKPHAGDEIPSSIPAGYAGLIALGGRMDAKADEQYQWLTTERSLMKDAIAQDFPFVGICLGAQILATAVDGDSIRTPMPEAGVIGLAVNQLAASDELFGPLAGQVLPVTAWHQDYIVDLPDDALVLASTEECPVHAYRIGENVYGMQFHPEVTVDTVSNWATPNDSVLAKLNKSADEALEEVRNNISEIEKTWKPVFQRWANQVKAATT